MLILIRVFVILAIRILIKTWLKATTPIEIKLGSMPGYSAYYYAIHDFNNRLLRSL